MITWEPAGTGEPGDQWGTSSWPGGEWLIGPNPDGTWSVELVLRDENGADDGSDYFGSVADEGAAKAMAEAEEKDLEKSSDRRGADGGPADPKEARGREV